MCLCFIESPKGLRRVAAFMVQMIITEYIIKFTHKYYNITSSTDRNAFMCYGVLVYWNVNVTILQYKQPDAISNHLSEAICTFWLLSQCSESHSKTIS